MIFYIWLLVVVSVSIPLIWLLYKYRYSPIKFAKGILHESSGYQLLITRVKGRISEFRIFIVGESLPELTIRKCSAVHLFFNRFADSISNSSDPNSDSSKFTLLTDNQKVRQFFFSSGELKRSIDSIFNKGYTEDFKLRGLHCYNNRIYGIYAVSGSLSDEKVKAEAEKLAPDYLNFQRACRVFSGFLPEDLKDPGLNKIKFIQAVIAAIGVSALLQFIRIMTLSTLPLIHKLNFILFTQAIGIAFCVIALFILYLLFKNSSRFYRIIIEFLLFGIIGILLGSFVFLNDINTNFDSSQAIKKEPEVISTYEHIKRSKYSAKVIAHAMVKGLGKDSGEIIDIVIPGYVYKYADPGRKITLFLKSGALGYDWIESFDDPEKLPPMPEINY